MVKSITQVTSDFCSASPDGSQIILHTLRSSSARYHVVVGSETQPCGKHSHLPCAFGIFCEKLLWHCTHPLQTVSLVPSDRTPSEGRADITAIRWKAIDFFGGARCRKPRSHRSCPERHPGTEFHVCRHGRWWDEPTFITARGASVERYMRSSGAYMCVSS
jgi:hypothetical protein